MKRNPFTKRLLIAFIIDFVLVGAFFTLRYLNQSQTYNRQISQAGIQSICELATLDCYYHNVSEWSKPGNFIGYGAKKFWIEYDGTVSVGIIADQIRISEPDRQNVIIVTMPEATVLDIDLDEDSTYEIDSESPMWGFIPLYQAVSTEERRDALAKAQDDMAAGASQNQTILNEARERAKEIIRRNIIAAGEAVGVQYTVEFIDADEPVTPSSAPVE